MDSSSYVNTAKSPEDEGLVSGNGWKIGALN